MKKVLAVLVSVAFLFGVTAAMAQAPAAKPEAPKAEAKKAEAPKAEAAKAAAPAKAKKAATMKASGKVLEVSDAALKVEAMVKDKAETMEFALAKPLKGIAAGDNVTVTYTEKDGKLAASKVAKAAAKKEKAPAAEKKEKAPAAEKKEKAPEKKS